MIVVYVKHRNPYLKQSGYKKKKNRMNSHRWSAVKSVRPERQGNALNIVFNN
mgnify:CR=1 FL=1